MLQDNIINPSASVERAITGRSKKELEKQKLSVVVDFRKLKLIIGDSFSLPNIIDVLNQLGNISLHWISPNFYE